MSNSSEKPGNGPTGPSPTGGSLPRSIVPSSTKAMTTEEFKALSKEIVEMMARNLAGASMESHLRYKHEQERKRFQMGKPPRQ